MKIRQEREVQTQELCVNTTNGEREVKREIHKASTRRKVQHKVNRVVLKNKKALTFENDFL